MKPIKMNAELIQAIDNRNESLSNLKQSLINLNNTSEVIERIEGDADYFIRDGLGFDISDKIKEVEQMLKEASEFRNRLQSN